MAIALNKTTLKQQRDQAKTFQQFLPSLDLKRQQLLVALKQAREQLAGVESQVQSLTRDLVPLYPLLGSSTIPSLNLAKLVRVQRVVIESENMVGTKLPVIRDVEFGIVE